MVASHFNSISRLKCPTELERLFTATEKSVTVDSLSNFMRQHSIPHHGSKTKFHLAELIAMNFLRGIISITELERILHGLVVLNIPTINDFTIRLIHDKPSWLLSTRSSDHINHPGTYFGMPVHVEISPRQLQVAPGAGLLSSSSYPGRVGMAGYTTVDGTVMIVMEHFTEIGDRITGPTGQEIGTTTRKGPAQICEVTMDVPSDFGIPVRPSDSLRLGDVLYRPPTVLTHTGIDATIIEDHYFKWITQASQGQVSNDGDSNMVWESPGRTRAVGAHNSFDFTTGPTAGTSSVHKLDRSRAIIEQLASGDQKRGQKRMRNLETPAGKEPNKRCMRSGRVYDQPPGGARSAHNSSDA